MSDTVSKSATVSDTLLKVDNLRTTFGPVVAVNDVSFEIRKGETLGLVGESGSGKSVTAFSIIRLVQEPGRIEGGHILFQGKDLLALSEEDMRQVRGAGIGDSSRRGTCGADDRFSAPAASRASGAARTRRSSPAGC